jgi:hypothetical protein
LDYGKIGFEFAIRSPEHSFGGKNLKEVAFLY